jgi:hypothetical protein
MNPLLLTSVKQIICTTPTTSLTSMSTDAKYGLVLGFTAILAALLLYFLSDIHSLSHLEEVIKTAH